MASRTRWRPSRRVRASQRWGARSRRWWKSSCLRRVCLLSNSKRSGRHTTPVQITRLGSPTASANAHALAEEKRHAEERLASAKRMKEDSERRYAELKSSGIGSEAVPRDVAEKLAEEVQAAQGELKVTKAARARLSTVLVALQQGAVGAVRAPTGGLGRGARHAAFHTLTTSHSPTRKAQAISEAQAKRLPPRIGGSPRLRSLDGLAPSAAHVRSDSL